MSYQNTMQNNYLEDRKTPSDRDSYEFEVSDGRKNKPGVIQSLREKTREIFEMDFNNDKIDDQWDISHLYSNNLYHHFVEFKSFLVQNLNLEEDSNLDFEEILEVISVNFHTFSEEEFCGLALYLVNMLLIYKSQLKEKHLDLLFEKVVHMIEICVERKNISCLFLSLEILELMDHSDNIASSSILMVNLFKIVQSLELKTKIIGIMLNQGRQGTEMILKLMEEFSGVSKREVLLGCAYYPKVMKKIVIPFLMNDLKSKRVPISRRNQAAACLSRFGILLEDDKILRVLGKMVKNSSHVDPLLITSCIVNAGVKGKKLLISTVKEKIKPDLKSIICMYLRDFNIKTSIPDIQIKLVDDLPGFEYNGNCTTVWAYSGEVFPRIPQHQINAQNPSEPVLLCNQQEFEALVRNYLISGYSETRKERLEYKMPMEKFTNSYWILFRGSGLSEQKNYPKIVIRTLINATKDEDNTVREAALNSLGNIGLPFVKPAKERIIISLEDKSAKVRAMAVWALGCFEGEITKKVLTKICKLLDDRFLQVRTSACVALGILSPKSLSSVMPKLVKSLKDGSINREVVCETIMLLNSGVDQLIEIATKYHRDPMILRSIIKAFKKAEGNVTLIDSIISKTLKYSKHANKTVRKAAIETIVFLSEGLTVDQKIYHTFLRPSNLAQNIYTFIQDQELEIRVMARNALLNLGHFGRMVLTQGVRMEQNSNAKIQCVQGLKEYGMLGFRSIVMALASPDQKLNRAVSSILTENYKIEAVLGYFSDKENEFNSLCLIIRKILDEINFISEELIEFLMQIKNFKNETKR